MNADGSAARVGPRPAAADFDAAFARVVPASPPPVAYRLRVALVAVAMFLLPALYFAIVAGIAWLTWLHAVHDAGLVSGRYGSGIWSGLVYVTPLFAGTGAVVLLVKPFLRKREVPPAATALSRGEEPVLHEFADRVARAVGAPPPKRIEVDLDVNASARLARGLRSLFVRRDLVLTIGLPLVRGLTAGELGSVLAHEFGHFAQGAGMRLSWIIRQENAWLARIAAEPDPWEAQLARHWNSGSLYGRVIAGAMLGVNWCVRRLLLGLAFAGHAVSCALSREMEFDADRRSYLLTGVATFESAQGSVRRLAVAAQSIGGDLRDAWVERWVVDDLAALVVAACERQGDDVLRAIDEARRGAVTGRFDTHPSDSDRLARARSAGPPDGIALAVPASSLFRGLDALSRRVTAAATGAADGAAVVSVEKVLAHARTRGDERAAVRRYLQDLAMPIRPLFPRRRDPATADPRDEVRRCRDLLLASVGPYREALRRLDEAQGRRRLALRAGEFLAAGVKIRHATFGLGAGTDEAVRAAVSDAEIAAAAAVRELEPVEAACLARYEIAVELLSVPAVDGTAAGPDTDLRDAVRARESLAVLEAVWRDVLRLAEDRETVSMLVATSRGAPFEKKIAHRIDAAARRLMDSLTSLRTRLDATYPFADAVPAPTIGAWAIDAAAGGDLRAVAVDRASRAMMRLFELHQRLHGRLAIAAERAEESAGFPPLPDPAASAPAGPAPAVPRTSHF